jgi:hypothetical protein
MKRAGFTVGKYLVVSMFNNELVKPFDPWRFAL